MSEFIREDWNRRELKVTTPWRAKRVFVVKGLTGFTMPALPEKGDRLQIGEHPTELRVIDRTVSNKRRGEVTVFYA